MDIKTETTVTLTLTGTEAYLLKSLVQNPPMGCSVDVEKFCYALFETLKSVKPE